MGNFPVNTSANFSTLGYLSGDDLIIGPGVTLTITATPTIQIRSIQASTPGSALVVSNASTSTMLKLEFSPSTSGTVQNALLFSGGSEATVTGDWITVTTGTGSANQTIFSSMTVGGQNIDYPTYVRVETGNGTNVWEQWAVVPEEVTNYWRGSSGFNTAPLTSGTVAVAASGVVTGTGTAFSNIVAGKRFRAPAQSQDYVVLTYTSATSITIGNPDGSTYTGPTIGAGSTYQIKRGVYNRQDFGAGEIGTVLFFDPLLETVTCGDGTYGKVIPSGARVQIPNIMISAAVQSTTLAAAITSTTATSLVVATGTGALFPPAVGSGTTGTLLVTRGTGASQFTERMFWSARSTDTFTVIRGAYLSEPATFSIGDTVRFIPSAAGQQNGVVAISFSGAKLSIDKAFFGVNFGQFWSASSGGIVNAKSVSIKNCGFYRNFRTGTGSGGGVIGGLTLENCVLNGDCRSNGDASTNLQFAAAGTGGSLVVKNILMTGLNAVYSGSNTGTTTPAQITQNLQVSEISNFKVFMSYKRSILEMLMTNIDGVTVDNLKMAGMRLSVSGANSVVKQVYFSGSPSPVFPGYGQGPTAMLNVTDGAIECIFRDFRNLENAPHVKNTSFLSVADTARGNIIHNKGSPAFNCHDAVSQIASLFDGENTTCAWFDFTNNQAFLSSIPFVSGNLRRGSRRVRVLSDTYSATPTATGTGMGYNIGGLTELSAGPQPQSVTSGAFFDSQAFTVCTDPATVNGGNLCMGSLFADEEYVGTYTGLSTTAYLSGKGELYYTTANDSVTIKSQVPLRGISQFDTGGTITYVGGNNVTTNTTFEFKMAKWGDALPGSWTALTLANLETARAALSGYSTAVGIDFAVRITVNAGAATATTRRINIMKLPIFWDTAYNPAVGTFDLNVTGIMTGSVVAVSLDGGTTWPSGYKATATGSTVTIPIDCDFLGATTNLKVRIRKAGYQVLEYDLSTVDADVDIPIDQVQVVDIDGVAVYGRGGGTTTAYITIVPGSLRVDIGNILVVGEDLYDTCAAYQATTAGIVYPEILQFDGTDSIILNTWKLRRNVAGSTNAMIDMIVKYGPNVTVNPVDEANGSVQLFPRVVRQGSLGAIAATVWDYQTSSATTSGSMGERLKDASTVATTGAQIAETLG